ncbi:MAG: hypothetical protein ACMUJM_11580 [bacterium]
MGERYIKEENAKEVVYEEGILGDIKIGELYENLDGSKETRNFFGPEVKVELPSIFSLGRKGEIDGQKGEFRKDLLDKNQTFKPGRS